MRNKPIVLLSFLPALAYWILEETATVEIAVAGGMGLAIIEFYLEKKLTGHIHNISKLNFLLIIVLGSFSLYFKEGLLFKLQPFFTGLFFGGALLVFAMRKKSLMMDFLKGMQRQTPPEWVIMRLERDLGFFMLAYGIFMAYVAVKMNTGEWLFYKTGGFYLCFAFFALIDLFFIRKKAINLSKKSQLFQQFGNRK